MKRKAPAAPAVDKFYFKYPFGGMTPYPPESCPAHRLTVDENGVRWADNYYCATICSPKYCNENREYRDYIYKKMGKEV